MRVFSQSAALIHVQYFHELKKNHLHLFAYSMTELQVIKTRIIYSESTSITDTIHEIISIKGCQTKMCNVLF